MTAVVRRMRAMASPPPPTAATAATAPPPPEYKRPSLKPLYQLAAAGEFGKFEIFDETMAATDFTTAEATLRLGRGRSSSRSAPRSVLERGTGRLDLFLDDGEPHPRAADPVPRQPYRRQAHRRSPACPRHSCRWVVASRIRATRSPSSSSTDNTVKYVTRGHPPAARWSRTSRAAWCSCATSTRTTSRSSTARFDRSCSRTDGVPVEIPTEFYCTDLLVVEREPAFGEVDELFLYVANEHRASVMKYSIDLIRDINDDVCDIRINHAAGPGGRAARPHRRDRRRGQEPLSPAPERGADPDLRRQQPRW